jgi:hypothetical protein
MPCAVARRQISRRTADAPDRAETWEGLAVAREKKLAKEGKRMINAPKWATPIMLRKSRPCMHGVIGPEKNAPPERGIWSVRRPRPAD